MSFSYHQNGEFVHLKMRFFFNISKCYPSWMGTSQEARKLGGWDARRLKAQGKKGKEERRKENGCSDKGIQLYCNLP
jgi:hypothetical protein